MLNFPIFITSIGLYISLVLRNLRLPYILGYSFYTVLKLISLFQYIFGIYRSLGVPNSRTLLTSLYTANSVFTCSSVTSVGNMYIATTTCCCAASSTGNRKIYWAFSYCNTPLHCSSTRYTILFDNILISNCF